MSSTTEGLAQLREFWKRSRDARIGALLGTLYVIWLLATARSLGFSRDEGFYFSAASEYERWFDLLFKSARRAFERSEIDDVWKTNHEHPSLMKSLFALSHHFVWGKGKHGAGGVFADASTAFRLPGMLSMGLAIAVTYVFSARVFNRRAGVLAAVLLGAMPNVFYHAHLACFDVPIMAMWITCVYTYYVAEREGGLGWALILGVVYGLTLETKHNAWMLPAVFVPHALLVHGSALARDTRGARLSVPTSLVAMATIGPAVFVLLWPWLWNDTLPRIQQYVAFHVHHEYYNIEFLGRTYFGPPSPKAYMPVMIAATVPTTTLVLFAIGASRRLRVLGERFGVWFARAWTGPSVSEPNEPPGRATSFLRALAARPFPPTRDALHTDVLLFLSLAVPLAVFLLPTTPIFGGTKHWITAYPALAMFAGYGADRVLTSLGALVDRHVTAPLRKNLVLGALAASLVLAPLAVTAHSHPFGLSAYVPFFGGTAGGADLGLNRQFWGFTTQSLDPWFREHTKPGDTVYIMDTAWSSWQRMIEEDRIPKWLRGVGSPAEATISIVHHEQHMNEVDYNIWTEYGTTAPEYVLSHDGVPIISVYRRPSTRAR